MNVAIVTPIPPDQSGIADFSAQLRDAFHAHSDVRVSLYRGSEFNRDIFRQYDRVIYQLGNNATFHQDMLRLIEELPGIVEIHDLTLHNMVAGMTVPHNDRQRYVDEFAYNYGEAGRRFAEYDWDNRVMSWETMPNRFRLLGRVLDHADHVIVHSKTAAEVVRRQSRTVPCTIIPHIARDPGPGKTLGDRREGARVRVASFGQIQPNKLIPDVIRAVAAASKRYEVEYVLAGSAGGMHNDIRQLAHDGGIADRLKMLGRMEEDAMLDLMRESDIVVSLRYPSFGETSGVVINALTIGSALIVTNTGWYGELPDDVVVKVPVSVDALRDKLLWLLGHPEIRDQLAQNSREWAERTMSPSKVIPQYHALLREAPDGRRRIFSLYARKMLQAVGDLPPQQVNAALQHKLSARE